MYSREERMKAIRLYIKYNESASDAIRELGYPDRKTLRVWYKNYLNEQKTGVSHDKYIKIPKPNIRRNRKKQPSSTILNMDAVIQRPSGF